MSEHYRVQVDRRVVRELRRIHEKDAERLIAAIRALAVDARPAQSTKLVHQPGHRLRVGSYRILYEVNDAEKCVRVYRAGHRRNVYR